MSATGERPLDEVLSHGWSNFTPARPGRPPWHRPTLRHVEIATTGIVAIIPLEIADRAHLHGLDRPSDWQDDLEPFDWTPAGWGVQPTSRLGCS